MGVLPIWWGVSDAQYDNLELLLQLVRECEDVQRGCLRINLILLGFIYADKQI